MSGNNEIVRKLSIRNCQHEPGATPIRVSTLTKNTNKINNTKNITILTMLTIVITIATMLTIVRMLTIVITIATIACDTRALG